MQAAEQLGICVPVGSTFEVAGLADWVKPGGGWPTNALWSGVACAGGFGWPTDALWSGVTCAGGFLASFDFCGPGELSRRILRGIAGSPGGG